MEYILKNFKEIFYDLFNVNKKAPISGSFWLGLFEEPTRPN
jgi:hypothetical protein